MKLQLDPDRLFPVDPATRDVARGLYESVSTLPIISPHGHIAPALLLHDTPFVNPAELFIRYDHYVTRLLHAAGVSLDALGIPETGGVTVVTTPREVWRTFCEHWLLYAGTASGYWLQNTFARLFGIDEQPATENADRLYDRIQTALETEAFRPRALFDRFGIEVLATTDDPMDDLAAHEALALDPAFTGRVLPTFRPDAVQRFRASVTETAGFYRGSGFIDDTRAFLSIPARHDMSRRLDAAFLARLVREGRLDLAAAERIAVDLVDTMPRKVFKL